MTVSQLHVLHSNEPMHSACLSVAGPVREGRVLVLHTCQRVLAVSMDAEAIGSIRAHIPANVRSEYRTGAGGYELLLRLACGLESRLAGETEVFGQFKQCWSDFVQGRSHLAQALSGTMQTLFRDVKEIRSQHLTGTGSASYGSLVRRVLAAHTTPAPVLMIGAGQLAQTVAPWLKSSELWLWNRNQERAQQLADDLRRRDAERVVTVLPSTPDAELAAWRAARDVVVCVPADAGRDAARVAAWSAPKAQRGRLVHLGFSELPADGSPLSQWGAAADLLHLGHMFEMLRTSNEQRAAQLEQARNACADKALQALAPRAAVIAGLGRGAATRVHS